MNKAEQGSFGRFKILKILGQGAQGMVLLANDPHLERQVAIKTLFLEGAGDRQELTKTLLDEARTIAKLQHPNIVTLYDAGEQDHSPYLVFEYVEGQTLDKYLEEKGVLPVSRAIEIAAGVLDGISYAHMKNVVHRDIKPSNILIDLHNVPRIMDFGIATRTAAEGQGKVLLGTPLYMAPEYISERVSGPKSDQFALAMMLYLMLAGESPVTGTTVMEVLRNIVSQAFEHLSQRNAEVTPALDMVVMKALSKNPDERYPDALSFKKALLATLSPEQQVAVHGSSESRQGILDFLMRRIRYKSDFPALSSAISTINRIVGSEQQGSASLSNAILKDFALTNKLLRLVNTAFYSQFGGTISTISRAVVILGFETIRNVAITLVLFEHLQNKSQATQLKDEIIASFFSGIVARQLVAKAGIKDAEEALICAMFHNLGKMLTLYYFHEEAQQIAQLQQEKEMDEREAATLVLGLPYDEMGMGIAKAWNFPEKLVHSMRHVTEDKVAKPHTDAEKLRMVSALANEVTRIAGGAEPEMRKQLLADMVKRFGGAVTLNEEGYVNVIEGSMHELQKESIVLRADTRQAPFFHKISQWVEKDVKVQAKKQANVKLSREAETTQAVHNADMDLTILSTDVAGLTDGLNSLQNDEVVETVDSQSVLTAGIQDITNTLVDDFSLNDVLRMILETMYRGMGFTHVLLCIRDSSRNALIGRFGFGPDIDRIMKSFNVPLTDKTSVFFGALHQGVDIFIQDINSEKIKNHIPDWYRKLVPAQSFILFPIVINKKPIGLFYADKNQLGELNIQPKELRLLKTLRNQAVLAIKQK